MDERPDDPWAALAAGFAEPPAAWRPMPFWFWNAEMTAELIRSQLSEMRDVGVPGVYVHCRSGMRPRYLTEEWWERVDTAVEVAAASGMRLGFVDEFNWPSGEARDFTLDGAPSRVRAADRSHRMRRLEMERCAASEADRLLADPAVLLLVAGVERSGGLGPETLQDVTAAVRGRQWEPGSGEELFAFRLVDATGFDGGTVDLMSPAATEAFLDAFYRPLVARYPEHLGSTIVGTFVDHEGDFGERLAWTPRLFDAYADRWGDRLEPRLPLLVLDHGPLGREVRTRYMTVVTELYTSAFFDRLRDFAEGHGLTITGHVWEESLVTSAAYQGSHFAIQRAWSTPGVDSLYDWARRARHFKEAATVAHVEGKPLVVEAQGVLGAGAALTPDLIRGTAAMSAVWGAQLLVPHALNANVARTDFPEDWFLTQPWWPYFGDYLTCASRLCWLNSVGVHRAPVLLYHPIESVWPYTAPAFDGSWSYRIDGVSTDHGAHLAWGNETDDVERVYDELLEVLSRGGLDCDVADAEYLRSCRVDEGRLHLGAERYDVLVLPHLTAVDVTALEHLAGLVEQGATVVSATADPPTAAANAADRPRIVAAWDRLCACDGRFLVRPPDAVRSTVAALVEMPFTVRAGEDGLRWQHRVLDDGSHVLMLVNVDRERIEAEIGVPAGLRAELWDPETGGRRVAETPDGVVTLDLRAWQAMVLVAAPAATTPEPGPAVVRGETGPGEVVGRLDGPWVRRLEQPEVALPWGRDPGTGAPVWLDAQRHSLRDWMLIGPFDYGTDHQGWAGDFGPESDDDPRATYPGKYGPVEWLRHHSEERVVDLTQGLGLPNEEWSGDRYRTCYASTDVYSDEAATVELRVVADSNVKAWVNGDLVLANRDDHHGYLELHDGFGDAAVVGLGPGWNRILLKVSQGLRYGGRYGFSARLCDPHGSALLLPCAAEPAGRPGRPRDPECVEVDIPAGADTVRLPGLTAVSALVVDGSALPVVDGTVVLSRPLPSDVVARIECGDGEVLTGAPRCRMQAVAVELGSLTTTALRHHSGVVVYETRLEVDAELARTARWLDLGDVGCSARVRIDGEEVGTRPWPPYRLEVWGMLAPGHHRLEVEVANSGAHRRAGQDRGDEVFGLAVSGPGILNHVPLSGLAGPVRLLR